MGKVMMIYLLLLLMVGLQTVSSKKCKKNGGKCIQNDTEKCFGIINNKYKCNKGKICCEEGALKSQIDELNKKVEELNKKVDEILKLLAKDPVTKMSTTTEVSTTSTAKTKNPATKMSTTTEDSTTSTEKTKNPATKMSTTTEDSTTSTEKITCAMRGGYPIGDRCLRFSFQKKNWTNAMKACDEMNGHLASPVDLQSLVDFDGPPITERGWQYGWLGASDAKDEGIWRWLNGDIIKQTIPWAKGCPNGGIERNCMYFHPALHGYCDLACSSTQNFICDMGGLP